MPNSRADRRGYPLAAVMAAALLAPLAFDGYYLDVIATALLLGLFAAAVDLSLGYTGILNLGSALYFGVGAYCAALAQRDGFAFGSGLLFAVLVTGVLSAVIGIIGLKLQRSAIQFALLGLVVSLSFEQLAINSYTFAGGSNGITSIRFPSLLGIATPRYEYFYLVVVVVAALIGLLIFLSRSHAGRLLILTRDEPEKAVSLGYDVDGIKIVVTMITAVVSAVAGALYVPLIGIAYPEMFSVVPNMLVLVWVAIGGLASLVGPFLLAALLKIVEFELGSRFVDWYLLILGALFVLVVTMNSQGVWRVLGRLSMRK